jgi:hypothetical protein
MTIAELIRRGKGKAGPWRIERGIYPGNENVLSLWHYGTRMLVWNADDPTDEETLDWSIGYGSVSDQNGMNTAFRILNLPYRFDRDQKGGGPRITDISDLLAA